MRADGGEAEKLTDAKAGVSGFRWSLDGSMIAFLARDAKTDEEQKRQERRDDPIYVDHDDKYNRLWLVDLNDHKSALVTRQDIEVIDFDWSPDATSLAIAFTSVPGFRKDGNLQLAVVRRSNGELLRALSENVGIFNTNIRWSPDVTGGFEAAHYFASATLLDDGRVLVVGGYSQGAGGLPATSCAWLYRP